MRSERKTLTCTACGKSFSARVITQVDFARPEDREANFADGSLFTFVCPHCKAENRFNHYLLWVDEGHTVAVCNLTCEEEKAAMEEALSALISFGKASSIRRRFVSSPARLYEKIEIFTAGLDDRAVEILKLYFADDMRRTHPNKTVNDILFFSKEGGYGFLVVCADGDLTLDIPKDAFETAAEQFRFGEPSSEWVDSRWALAYLTKGGSGC